MLIEIHKIQTIASTTMKNSAKFLAAATLAVSAPVLLADGHGDPYRPVGDLDIAQTMVRSGTKPSMDWDITYPVTIPDLIIPQPTGRIITKEELRVKIRVAGVAFQSGSTELPVAFWTKIGGGSWDQLFYGTGSQVNSGEYVFEQVVPANTTIDFAGRARKSNGGWHDVRWTLNDDVAVIGCVNGDTPPSYAPAYDQGSIESFLSSYISEDNHVTIGPRDMIYLFELASRNPGDWWFDMQDLVVVVTYEQTTTTAP